MAENAITSNLRELNRLWHRFQEQAEFRIMEGNTVAGERLWETVKSCDLAGTLTIRSTQHPPESVECTVDPETLLLTCKYATRPVAALEFHLADATAGVLDEALTQVLDSLIWTEDGAGQAAAGAQ